MSNTLNLGDGKWAAKEGSLLAYNSENSNFKPLPFSFDRAGSATRVNKQGLIEVVSNNEPRIDFLNDSKGALLLEPSRTNLVTYSENLSDSSWSKSQSSATLSNITSPKGTQNVYKFTENTASSKHQLFTTISSYTELTISFFAKKEERSFIAVEKSGWGNTIFDLNIGSVVSGTGDVIDFGNGWFRCSASYTASPAQTQFYLILMQDSNTNNYQGDGNSGLYLWGIQAETGSYATSYIPTQGSIGTRVAESCNQTPPSGIINSSEGVLYVEVEIPDPLGLNLGISLSDGTFNNRVCIAKNALSSDVVGIISVSGNVVIISGSDYSDTDFIKIAISYKSGETKLFVNSNQIGNTSLTNFTLPSLGRIGFDIGNGTTAPFYGNVKDLRIYNTALTDQELINLTKI